MVVYTLFPLHVSVGSGNWTYLEDRTIPRGPCETPINVSRQKLTPHCLATIFDSQLPLPKVSPKMPPKLSLAQWRKRGHFFLFQNCPRGEGNCETIERQKLSRGNFLLKVSLSAHWVLKLRIRLPCTGVKNPKSGKEGFGVKTPMSPHPRKGRCESKNPHFLSGTKTLRFIKR